MTQVPKALDHFDGYQELTDSQKTNFLARLDYVQEIIINIKKWLVDESEWDNLNEFLDDLELDVAANQNLVNDDDFISNWLIHSTWLDEFEPRQVRAELSPEMLVALEGEQLSMAPSRDAVDGWLDRHQHGLNLALRVFSDARTVPAALSAVLVLNSLLASLLAGLYRLRLR